MWCWHWNRHSSWHLSKVERILSSVNSVQCTNCTNSVKTLTVCLLKLSLTSCPPYLDQQMFWEFFMCFGKWKSVNLLSSLLYIFHIPVHSFQFYYCFLYGACGLLTETLRIYVNSLFIHNYVINEKILKFMN